MHQEPRKKRKMRKNTVWKNNIAMENKYKEEIREDKHSEGGEYNVVQVKTKGKGEKREEGKNEREKKSEFVCEFYIWSSSCYYMFLQLVLTCGE